MQMHKYALDLLLIKIHCNPSLTKNCLLLRKYSVDSRKNEMLEKPVQLSEPLSRPTKKKVETSSSASSNASETNSVDSGSILLLFNFM